MVLYDEKTREAVWESDTLGVTYGQNLKLVAQNDNNLVLYGSSERPLWASETVNQCSYF